MGRKVHPYGFRIGTTRDWQAKWYADKHYADFLQEDVKIRQAVREKYAEAGVSLVEIERQASKVSVTIYTARPGIVIGRGGQRVDEVRRFLEALIDKKIQLNIQEIRQPELDAYLVARSIAEQIERRIAYRRAMKQAIFRTLQAGALGIKIKCSGRLAGAEIARSQMMHQGRVPLHTLRADVDYGVTEAHTTMGRIGIKVWIYRGDILPEIKSNVMDESSFNINDETEIVEKSEAPEVVEKEEIAKKPKAKRAEKAKAVEEVEEAEEKETEEKTVEDSEKVEKPKKKKESKTTEEASEEKTEKPVKKEAVAKDIAEKPAKKQKEAEVAEEATKKPAKKKKEAEVVEETSEKPVKTRAKKKDASDEA
jgi:small subunit ribosomal protein S3